MQVRQSLRIKHVCFCAAAAISTASGALQLQVRPAYAFCQSTICTDTESNANSSTCTGDKTALETKCPTKRWAQMPIPVRFHYKYSSKLIVGETKRALRAAMNRWSDVICKNRERTSLRFQELPETLIDKPIVNQQTERQPGKGTEPFGIYFRETGWDIQDKRDQIAITHLFTGAADPNVKDADIVINSSNFAFALDEDPEETAKFKALGDDRVDFEAAITHEFGHYIGLAHSLAPLTIMAASKCGVVERCIADQQVIARRLREDDELAVCTLYPPILAPNGTEAPPSGCQAAATRVPLAPLSPLAALVAFVVGLRHVRRHEQQRHA
jgi:Matrixin